MSVNATPPPFETFFTARHPAPLQVQWRKSRTARRISLKIDPRTASVVVVLPPRTSQARGRAFLAHHLGWAEARLASLAQIHPLADGATVQLAGEPHTIRHAPAARRGAWLEDAFLNVSGPPEHLARRVTDLLRREAQQRLGALARHHAAAAAVTPRRITLKDTRSRWGSCTAHGTLMFSWRLVMAPPAVQDYVVAHEVAHLRHLNHGPLFWALVAELTPHRAMATAWLTTHGPELHRVG